VALEGKDREKHYENLTCNIPSARAGAAEEAALGILFLIQNDYTTGTTVDVDGGLLLS